MESLQSEEENKTIWIIIQSEIIFLIEEIISWISEKCPSDCVSVCPNSVFVCPMSFRTSICQSKCTNAIYSLIFAPIQMASISMEFLWIGKGFENKRHQRRAHYLKPRRNGRPIPTGGGSRSPPTLVRVNTFQFLFMLFNANEQ